ncbi:hypothetical protein EHQ61_04830 [Leptospira wolffii]|uniref:hypothetical protein n=1 Tax=Leptospira wolffii TaxID=409998 RepID=UPI0010830826|nr:hypothetical protein [Leptospira wolffii]TGL53191.1 hypothetical protein EHQ61_04830 [Leptospira wolffii]
MEWILKKPETRISIYFSNIKPYERSTDRQGYKWTQLAIKLFEVVSESEQLTTVFEKAVRPTLFEKSRSDTYSEFLPLFSDLKEHSNLIISSWAKNREIFYKGEIVKYRELDRDRYEFDNSFEY